MTGPIVNRKHMVFCYQLGANEHCFLAFPGKLWTIARTLAIEATFAGESRNQELAGLQPMPTGRSQRLSIFD